MQRIGRAGVGKKGKPTSEHELWLYGVTKDVLFAASAANSCSSRARNLRLFEVCHH